MMCADYGNLREEIRKLEEAGIDIFHLDVMDGKFVQNFGMGLQDIEYIASVASKPVDVHLMIDHPGEYVEKFISMGISIVYIHPEADAQPARTLQKIVDAGGKAGIAINPGTAAETVVPLLNLADYVLAMTVNPGFSGQKYLPFVDEKIGDLLSLKKKYSYRLLVDGACTPQKIAELSRRGVDGFVLGTSALFKKEKPYRQIISSLRALEL